VRQTVTKEEEEEQQKTTTKQMLNPSRYTKYKGFDNFWTTFSYLFVSNHASTITIDNTKNVIATSCHHFGASKQYF
jgi:hypothetical protein